MKILILSNFYPPDVIGGYELLCQQAADGLRNHGHEVLVLTASPRFPVPDCPHVQRLFQRATTYERGWEDKLQPLTCTQMYFSSQLVNAHNIHILLRTLDTFQPDVVYLHNVYGLGGLGLLACLQYLRWPWVWHLGDNVPGLLCRVRELRLEGVVREFNRHIHGHYLACSRRVVMEIEESGLRLQGKVELLPYWINGTGPPRTTWFEAGRRLRIINAGQIGKHKGIHLLIEAAGLLRRQGYDNFAIDIYGNVYDPQFQCLIAEQDVADRVVLQGPRSQAELFDLYGQYDVFAFPTWEREPFGAAPVEAAVCGCVPVLTANCGLGEWLVHGVHCLKARRSAEDFARVLRTILDGGVDLKPLAHRVGVVARRDFHLNAVLPRIERALHEAAGRPRTGAGTPADAYRLALLAERLGQILVNEACAA